MNKSVNYSGDYLHANDFFTVELISIIVINLKIRKAAGYDNLTAEHFLYSHPAALILITYICKLQLDLACRVFYTPDVRQCCMSESQNVKSSHDQLTKIRFK